MCGIAGIVSMTPGFLPEIGVLKAMADKLDNRGPDGRGFYVDGPVGLAHTRLSILDLAGGQQPIYNEDKSICVIFNGEIFNYIELKKELLLAGHTFYTESDTEVIVHLYEEYGDKFVTHLNGQFAIALWDSVRQRFLLIRDRVGIAPLFYTERNNQLIFASEVKAILVALDSAPVLDPIALDQIFTFWSPVAHRSLFAGVNTLAPGEMMVIENGKKKIFIYWDFQFPTHKEDYLTGDAPALAEQLYELLQNATNIRLRSDVPVGAYLSGGLDSSALVALIRQAKSSDLRTFSIGFQDRGLDESEFQQLMVKHAGTQHTAVTCGAADIASEFIDTISHAETAILRTAPSPMKMLSRLVREQGYKVVLTGEGADEVLGGYDIFKEAKVRQFWSMQPNSHWRPMLLKKLYPYLNITSSSAGQDHLASFFGAGIDQPGYACFSHMPRWQTTAKAKTFFSEGFVESVAEKAERALENQLPAQLTHWDPFNRAQYIESKSLMAGYILSSQGDRMLMANSVEGRFPFLDHRVIEFASRLPPKFKMKVLNEKFLLKKAMEHALPKQVIQRYKQPYRAPDAAAFFDENGRARESYIDDLLEESRVNEYGYFNGKKVGLLVKKARQGRAASVRDSQALVGILSTQIWHYLFIEKFQKTIS